MTFLELCQKVATRSGTVSDTSPLASVAGQAGRKAKIVDLTADAWHNIQTRRGDWLFMRGEFSHILVIGAGAYSAGDLGLTRFSDFLRDTPDYRPHSTFEASAADEMELRQVSYEFWRQCYGRGAPARQRPVDYAVGPGRQFLLGPAPDKAYTLRGEYRKAAQRLAADADVPDLPEEFHGLIVWEALELLAGHDGRTNDVVWARQQAKPLLYRLVNEQTADTSLDSSF